jgi:class 3 adenylate cyclase
MAEAGPPDGRPLETPAVPDLPQAGARPDPTAAPHLTHGFLFADLRDYTSYVEVHGDRAGAALLERYRSLVRGIVSATGGAEIRTEGDSFYVVFGSVSAAVRAGLAIVDAAARTAAEPDPIRVGVGVHAGETTETPEGFVGLAVNIAARLCAQAKAGELVVSETVRGLPGPRSRSSSSRSVCAASRASPSRSPATTWRPGELPLPGQPVPRGLPVSPGPVSSLPASRSR